VPVLQAAVRRRWLTRAVYPEQIGGIAMHAEVGRNRSVRVLAIIGTVDLIDCVPLEKVAG
jgi:hypothetical protein